MKKKSKREKRKQVKPGFTMVLRPVRKVYPEGEASLTLPLYLDIATAVAHLGDSEVLRLFNQAHTIECQMYARKAMFVTQYMKEQPHIEITDADRYLENTH